MPALFQHGDFTLASGTKSRWKIECDALTEEDWDGLAVMLMDFLPQSFGFAYGVPRGGLPFAMALNKYADKDSYRILVVDDVWTTGNSMRKFIEKEIHNKMTRHNYFSAVVFARNPTPFGVTALFTMPS